MAVTGEFVRSAHALTGRWIGWTPSWTASTSNPVLGNGALTGRYRLLDRTVFFNLLLVAGSSTTFGTGFWQLSLPVEAVLGFAAACSVRDNSALTNYPGVADGRPDDMPTGLLRIGTRTGSGVTNLSPFTWAVNDTLKISGVYEAA